LDAVFGNLDGLICFKGAHGMIVLFECVKKTEFEVKLILLYGRMNPSLIDYFCVEILRCQVEFLSCCLYSGHFLWSNHAQKTPEWHYSSTVLAIHLPLENLFSPQLDVFGLSLLHPVCCRHVFLFAIDLSLIKLTYPGQKGSIEHCFFILLADDHACMINASLFSSKVEQDAQSLSLHN